MTLRYIADGFSYDAELLLNEFALEESAEFQIFVAIWRKKNFSFIYMGRDTSKELGEFTNEIFSLSSHFLANESCWHQIGRIFLLYALYKNQILHPPIRIRTDLAKFEILKRLLDKAMADKLDSLYYVLEFLFKNALELVASTTLLGPSVRIFDKSKSEFEKKLRMSHFQCNLEEFMENKVLEGLHESILMYDKLKPTPRNAYANNRCRKLVSILNKLAADQANIDGKNINLQSSSANGSSSMRSRRASKNLRCEYPFLNSDLNQISDVDELSENEFINENLTESELFGNSMTVNKEGGQPLECDEIVVLMPKPKKSTSSRRRVEKTRRIRKYYDGSPTKDIVCTKVPPVSSVSVLIETDLDDE